MRYFAKTDLDKLSLYASNRLLRNTSLRFIDKAKQNGVTAETLSMFDSSRVIEKLNKYQQILNIPPLYADIDKDYEHRTYLFKQVERICASIGDIKSEDPNILCLKLGFYIDVLLFIQPYLGRNQITYLYMQLEKDFDATLLELKKLPQIESEIVHESSCNGLLFSFCYGQATHNNRLISSLTKNVSTKLRNYLS